MAQGLGRPILHEPHWNELRILTITNSSHLPYYKTLTLFINLIILHKYQYIYLLIPGGSGGPYASSPLSESLMAVSIYKDKKSISQHRF